MTGLDARLRRATGQFTPHFNKRTTVSEGVNWVFALCANTTGSSKGSGAIEKGTPGGVPFSMVPMTGLEPVREVIPSDFKSEASANSATSARVAVNSIASREKKVNTND